MFSKLRHMGRWHDIPLDGNVATLTEHWNGIDWTIVDSPSPHSDAFLEAVSTINPDNVWAVGYDVPATTTAGASRALERHIMERRFQPRPGIPANCLAYQRWARVMYGPWETMIFWHNRSAGRTLGRKLMERRRNC